MTYCHTDVSHFEIQHAPKNSSLLAQLVERSAFKRICLSKDTEMSGVRAPYEEFFFFNFLATIAINGMSFLLGVFQLTQV